MRIVVLATWFLLSLPAAAAAFKEGPYPNVTGGFGEQTCRQCHFDNRLNAPGGRLTLSGVPATYVPGRSYLITVAIGRAGLRRAGFEVAARFASGAERGRQAGTWRPLDARVQVIAGAIDPLVMFVQHTLAGSRVPTRGSNTWTMEWTAPALAGAPVLFNVAANASNDDDSSLGDYIYVKAARSPAETRAKATPTSGARQVTAGPKR